jgi:hypothetical protein
LKAKVIIRDNKRQYIMINSSIHQEAIAVIKIYSSNNKDPKYLEQKWIVRAGRVAQVVGHLLSKCESEFKPQYHQIKKKKRNLKNGQIQGWECG